MLFADSNYKRDCTPAFAVEKDLAILCLLEVGSVSGLYFDYLAVAEVLHLLGK